MIRFLKLIILFFLFNFIKGRDCFFETWLKLNLHYSYSIKATYGKGDFVGDLVAVLFGRFILKCKLSIM